MDFLQISPKAYSGTKESCPSRVLFLLSRASRCVFLPQDVRLDGARTTSWDLCHQPVEFHGRFSGADWSCDPAVSQGSARTVSQSYGLLLESHMETTEEQVECGLAKSYGCWLHGEKNQEYPRPADVCHAMFYSISSL